MRLQKFLADAGVASRRRAEELIGLGQIKVNGKVVRQMGVTVGTGDRVEYKGKAVRLVPKKIYAFYKPLGVTSTLSDPNAEKTIKDFFKGEGRVYPVGRLDKNSEGLLLVTNDGDLANQLSHPRYEHEKEYEVRLRGSGDIERFKKSYRLDGYTTRPMQVVRVVPQATGEKIVNLVLKEGRKRQIRRVAEAIGLRVMNLKRIRIGKLSLGDLKSGRWRMVAREDII